MRQINDADRSIFVNSGSAPSEFGSEIRCNTFTTQAAADGDIDLQLAGKNFRVNYKGSGNNGGGTWAPLMVASEVYKTGQSDPDENETGWIENYGFTIDARNSNRIISGGYAAQGLGVFSVVPPNTQQSLPTVVYRSSGTYGGHHIFTSGGSSSNPADQEYNFCITNDGRLKANPNYVPSSGNDLATRAYVDANAGGGTGSATLEGLTDTDINSPVSEQFLVFRGGKWTNASSTTTTPLVPPGANPGVEWTALQWTSSYARSTFKAGLDGIFTDGYSFSTNGTLWNQAGSTVPNLLQDDSSQIHKSTSQSNWYMNDSGTAYSNDMRQWFSIDSLSSTTSNGGPYGNVFCFNGEFYLIARERATNNQGVPLTWKFLQYSRFYNQWLDPEDSTISDNIYAWLNTQDAQANVGYAPWWTDSQGVSGNYVFGRMIDGTVISLNPVTAEVSTVANLTGVLSIRYGGEKFVAQFDTGTKSIATSENPITSDWGTLAMYPKAGPYEVPKYDGVGRWHIIPSDQNRLLYLYADDRTNMVWIQNTNIGPKGSEGNNYLAAANGRVILGSVMDGNYEGPDYIASLTYYLSGTGVGEGTYDSDSKIMNLEKRILELEALIEEKCS